MTHRVRLKPTMTSIDLLDRVLATWLDPKNAMVELRATQRQSPVVLLLRGDLTIGALDEALAPIDAELKRGKRGLLVDVRRVTHLPGDARERFLRWSKAHRSEISAMAVVTESPTWRVVIKAMSLVGGRKMRAFEEPIRATAWLSES